MNKDIKATEYRIEPIVTMLRSAMISDGGTEKKAKELEGKWIELNKNMFAFEEADKVTLVYSDTAVVGCACGRCNNNVMCEHIIAFEALKSQPELMIKSPDYRWLQQYLFSKGWFSDEDRRVYPTVDDSEATESATLDPVHEDPDLDIGVKDDVAMVDYECPKCGDVVSIEGDKLQDWKLNHMDVCQGKKTANVPEIPEGSDDASTVAKNATVEKPPKKEDEKVKTSTAVTKPEPRTPAVRKEMPTEADFQRAKVERLMKSQGSIYKVSGKEVADSAAVSSYAVSAGVSTETTVLEQTSEYARATVRAHKGGRYTEGSVLIRRDAILEKIMIDLAEKNPDWIIGWSNGLPEFDLDQTVFVGDKRKILGLHIAGVVIDKWTFASRDCETKAGRRAQIKMLGSDWREDDEVESEVEEMNTVAKR